MGSSPSSSSFYMSSFSPSSSFFYMNSFSPSFSFFYMTSFSPSSSSFYMTSFSPSSSFFYMSSLSVSPLGPSTWHTGYPQCGLGHQSPINIVTDDVMYDGDMGDIMFTGFETPPTTATLTLENNGHAGMYRTVCCCARLEVQDQFWHVMGSVVLYIVDCIPYMQTTVDRRNLMFKYWGTTFDKQI